MMAAEDTRRLACIVNGEAIEAIVEPRLLLLDFLRDNLGLGGTHAGCEHGVCGACTVLFDDEPARSCLMFAVQVAGHRLTTIEGLAPKGSDTLHPIQQAFSDLHGLQCGFCTPGMIVTASGLLARNPDPTEDDVRVALAGNICRCTGYVNIVRAIMSAAERMR
jgi:aerobic-type carbon monoxide dehydrogenase small subunit (CoxS/CutS family)